MYNLIKKASEGDADSLEQAVKMNTGLVRSVVKRFTPRGCETEDLYQIGVMGLIKAIRRFEPAYGVRFSTYAVPLIAGEIKRFLRDDGMIKVSRHYKEIYSGAAQASVILSERYKREPTLKEIADEMGIDVYTLTEATEACTPCDSIDRAICDDGKGETYLLDMIMGEDDSSLSDRAALSLAISSLEHRERTIITCRYFLDETQTTVAKRLGISQVQVSRIEKRIINELKAELI